MSRAEPRVLCAAREPERPRREGRRLHRFVKAASSSYCHLSRLSCLAKGKLSSPASTFRSSALSPSKPLRAKRRRTHHEARLMNRERRRQPLRRIIGSTMTPIRYFNAGQNHHLNVTPIPNPIDLYAHEEWCRSSKRMPTFSLSHRFVPMPALYPDQVPWRKNRL